MLMTFLHLVGGNREVVSIRLPSVGVVVQHIIKLMLYVYFILTCRLEYRVVFYKMLFFKCIQLPFHIYYIN